MMKLETGDEVQILRGKDKGKKGKIEKIFAKSDQVLVTGVNMYKKHVKKAGKKPGGIVEMMKPLSVSKVVLVCPKCNLATKSGFVVHNDKKARICKKCKQQI